MDASSSNAGTLHIGKRASEPKHGKKPENRLWSRDERGDGRAKERDGTINPDSAIDVATVCGSQVRTYSEAKYGRRLKSVIDFPHRGAALVYAHDYEEFQRRPVQVTRVQRAAA